MTSNKNPVDQKIIVAVIESGFATRLAYAVGVDGCTRIELFEKNGLHCMIPYVRAWAGDVARGEWCQHAIVGIYFEGDPTGEEMRKEFAESIES